jgi:hypothetical protein
MKAFSGSHVHGRDDSNLGPPERFVKYCCGRPTTMTRSGTVKPVTG